MICILMMKRNLPKILRFEKQLVLACHHIFDSILTREFFSFFFQIIIGFFILKTKLKNEKIQ